MYRSYGNQAKRVIEKGDVRTSKWKETLNWRLKSKILIKSTVNNMRSGVNV